MYETFYLIIFCLESKKKKIYITDDKEKKNFVKLIFFFEISIILYSIIFSNYIIIYIIYLNLFNNMLGKIIRIRIESFYTNKY